MTTVFLPGTLCDERVFDPRVSALEAAGEVCWVLPLRVGTTVSACATWVLEQAPAHFNLVGFSQGAVVAFEIMRQAPERVQRLVLIAANPASSTETQYATWQRWREYVAQGRFEDVVPDLCQGLYYQHQDAFCDVLLAMARTLGETVFLQQLSMLASRIDSSASLTNIQCPVQLIVGQHDRITPVRVHEQMLERLPHATLNKITFSGHYVSLEQPGKVNQILHMFLG